MEFRRVLFRSRHFHLVYGLLEYVQNYILTISKQGDFEQAFERGKQVTDELINLNIDKGISENERYELLAIIDSQAGLMINVFLAYMGYVGQINRDKISSKLENVNWNRTADIYHGNFSSHLLPNLEWLSGRIKFEMAIEEGNVITPLWYQTELLAVMESNKMAESANSIVIDSVNSFTKWIKRMEEIGDPLLTSAFISREWEFWNKVDANFHRITSSYSNLTNPKYIEGLKWPEVNLETMKLEISNNKKRVLKVMSRYSISLIIERKNDRIPDYGGQFHQSIAEGILEALIEGDIELIKHLYKPYFYRCLALYDKNRNFQGGKKLDWRDVSNLKISSAPLLDLVDLSGYARMLSEYHDTPETWDHIVATWDEYIAKEEGSPTFFATIIALTENSPEIQHHSMIRMSWRQSIEDLLSKIPTKTLFVSNSFREELFVNHSAPVVRLFIKEKYKFRDGIDIFINFYFCKNKGFNGLKFGRRRVHDLQRMIDVEETFYKKQLNEQEAGE